MMLSSLGLDDNPAMTESVSIMVGPNGSGKSLFLRNLAEYHRNDRSVVIVCNTPHDRFVGLRGIRRISVGRIGGSPRVIVKKAVARSLAGSGAEFHQMSSILEYCGYRARFGFRIDPGLFYGKNPREIWSQLTSPFVEEIDGVAHNLSSVNAPDGPQVADFDLALAFFQRHDPLEPIWIDASEKILDFSRSREFASVLRLESKLRAWNVLRGIRVYLQPRTDSDAIEMQHASSGQLALISSLLFLITSVGADPIVIIDEPENSLHPKWQREYVDKVLTALSYRNPTVIVATHAPLVVTGALANRSDHVSVFVVRDGIPQRLPIDSTDSSLGSIEEVLWRAFDVVTPANHFVSEQIVDEVSRFEKGEVPKEVVLALIAKMERESFDQRQQSFFAAVRKLLDKVEAQRDGKISDGR
ncbi:AAA family ATPase [Lysobacter sp. A286]